MKSESGNGNSQNWNQESIILKAEIAKRKLEAEKVKYEMKNLKSDKKARTPSRS